MARVLRVPSALVAALLTVAVAEGARGANYDLGIQKLADGAGTATVGPGNTVTFTITVSNQDAVPLPAGTDVKVVDSWQPGQFSYVAASWTSGALTNATCVPTGGGTGFECTAQLAAALPPLDQLTVKGTATFWGAGASTVKNEASVTVPTPGWTDTNTTPGPSRNSHAAHVKPAAYDIAVKKTALPTAQWPAGSTQKFQLKLTKVSGADPPPGSVITVEDCIPGGAAGFVVGPLPSGTPWNCTGGGCTTGCPSPGSCVRCEYTVPTGPFGAPSVNIEVTAPVSAPWPWPTVPNEAVMTTFTAANGTPLVDAVASNGKSTATVTITGKNFAIEKKPPPVTAICMPGTVTYPIRVRNLGSILGLTTLVVQDTIPNGCTYTGFTQSPAGPGTWTCTSNAGVVTCTLTMPSWNSSAWSPTLQLSFGVSAPGTHVNTASITPSGSDANPADDQMSKTVALTAQPSQYDMGIATSVSPATAPVGAPFVYDLQLTNYSKDCNGGAIEVPVGSWLSVVAIVPGGFTVLGGTAGTGGFVGLAPTPNWAPIGGGWQAIAGPFMGATWVTFRRNGLAHPCPAPGCETLLRIKASGTAPGTKSAFASMKITDATLQTPLPLPLGDFNSQNDGGQNTAYSSETVTITQ